MPSRFRSRLLRHLGHDSYTPQTVRQLAEDLGVAKEDLDVFHEAIEELAADGQVIAGDDKLVRLPPIGREVIGLFKKNPRGFGFVIPKDANTHGDLFIPPDGTADAMTGDTVRAAVQRARGGRSGGGGSGNRAALVGAIVEILERGKHEFSGELRKRGSQWLVFPDGRALRDPIVVRDPGAKNAVEGDKVVFEIVSRPEANMLGEGVITKVLGKSGEPDVETAAVIATYNLAGEFPEDCVEQAREAGQRYDREVDEAKRTGSWPKREDLRDTYIITIDPPDAKDFDDAISIERLTKYSGGGWKLGVHIADVAHFIPPGTALDQEGYERGNSTYLPRYVIPMLPEQLSNGICSLQEGVPRYVKSAWMEYDPDGYVRASGFSQGVIQSAKRLTYLEAQALIDGDKEEAKKHAKTEPNYTDQLMDALRQCNLCSRAIQGRRMKQGLIRLDLHQVQLIFDDAGRVIDAEPEDDAFTHTLIEMFMVEANEAVARLFERLKVPLLRRVHPEPIPGDMDQLREFVTVAGYKLPKNPSRMELQSLLEATRGTPAARAVHFAALRSMTKAEYSPALIGHFALASEAYAHFTSPIRRYPDLTVHRALAAYLARTDNGSNPPRDDDGFKRLGRDLAHDPLCPDDVALTQVGRHCTGTEVNSAAAENDLRSFLVLQLLEGKIGETFPGVITGVTNAGAFIQIDKYLAEGLVKTEDLPTGSTKPGVGRWKIDGRTGALVEQTTGRSFNIGDKVGVIVAAVDLPARQMELLIADPTSREVGKIKKPLTFGEGGGTARAQGAGFGGMTGAQRRSKKSKSRDKGKTDYRDKRKGK